MHVVHSELNVKPESKDAFEQIERDYKATIEAWPGFKTYQVIGSTVYVSSTSPELVEPQPYLRYIHLVGWETREQQLAWTGSDQFAAWRDSVAPLTTAQYNTTFYETVLE